MIVLLPVGCRLAQRVLRVSVKHQARYSATGYTSCEARVCLISGHQKCREIWPSRPLERVYNIMLDALLLVLPLVVLTATYFLIARTLWRGMRLQNLGQGICHQCLAKTRNSISTMLLYFSKWSRINMFTDCSVILRVLESIYIMNPTY